MSSWNVIFTTSVKARCVWKNRTTRVMPPYNSIRWWSLWVCAKVVFEEWALIPAFLAHDEDFAKASRQKLSDALLRNPVQLREFTAFMELENFVQATYTLEGDGTLVFIVFEKLEELSAFIHVQNFPTFAQAIHNVFPVNAAGQRGWYQCALGECLTPAFQYYSQTVVNYLEVARSIRGFTVAQIFNPLFVKISTPNDVDINRLEAIPFLDNNVIQSLKDELPVYFVKAANIPDAFDPRTEVWLWWKSNDQELPAWSAAVQKVVLVEPSSASAERVASLLTTIFGDQQDHAIEAALVLRVNGR